MNHLSQSLQARSVPAGQLALYWLCQAGFVFKTTYGQTVYIDPYLSDVVERCIGFRRMTLSPISAEEVSADLVICTHEHLDHMDTDALPALARNAGTHFAGPVECVAKFRNLGIDEERCHLLEEAKPHRHGRTTIHPVFADHGDLAPDALGMVLDFDGIIVYHTGDTAYRPDRFTDVIPFRPDVMLPCINGAFGNMNAHEAALATQLIGPRIVIPTHFWMFVEQNGNPAQFLSACAQMAPETRVVLLKPGEELIVSKEAREICR